MELKNESLVIHLSPSDRVELKSEILLILKSAGWSHEWAEECVPLISRISRGL